jgi:hypothetical protein
MPFLGRFLAAFFIPIVVHLGMRRLSPRYVGVATGLAIGIVLLYLLQAVAFLLMLTRLVLLSGRIHDVFAVYFFPSKLLSTIIGSYDKYGFDVERWSPQNLVISALIWAFVGCVIGHLIDRRREKQPLVEVL